MNQTQSITAPRSKTYEITMTALMAAVTCILAPLSIPIGPVPISFTNLAIYLSLYLLGWKKGTISYLIYLLLGLVGLPVFSGFTGGPSKLAGPTGGYIIGFLFSALGMWAMEKLPGKKSIMQIVSMVVGLVVCYAFGTAWFMVVYGKANGPVGLVTALGWCVFPFIIPDLIKIALAYVLSRKLRKYVA